MSTTRQLSRPERREPPSNEAAGPDRMVSTGLSLACLTGITLPSPLSTTMLAFMRMDLRAFSTRSRKSEMTGSSLALSTAVTLLSTTPSSPLSS